MALSKKQQQANWLTFIRTHEAVHATEVKSYLACRLQWYWSASPPRGRNLEPRYTVAPLSIGHILHEALRSHVDEQTPVRPVFESLSRDFIHTAEFLSEDERTDALKDIDNLTAVLAHYEDWEHDVSRFDIVATEMKVKHELGGLPITGRFDAIAKHRNTDELWVLDYKSTSRYRTGWTERDLQAIIYTAIARRLYGPAVQGVVFRFILKSAPKGWRDLILKDGSITRSAQSLERTTYWDLRDAIIVSALAVKYGVPHDDAAIVLAGARAGSQEKVDLLTEADAAIKLQASLYYQQLNALARHSNYIWDDVVEVSPQMEKMMVDGLIVPTLREMYSNPAPAPTGLGVAWAQCGLCRFRDPCLMVMNGHVNAANEWLLERCKARQDQQEYDV